MTTLLQPTRTTSEQLRIWREFRELPGLRLTLGQACRLFDLEPICGAEALQGLIDAGVLRQVGPFYLRADLDSFAA